MDNATPSRCRRPLGARWRTANRGICLPSAAIRRGFMGPCPCYVDKKRGASQGRAWCVWMLTRPGTRCTARRPPSPCRGLWRLQSTERSSAQQESVRGPCGPEPCHVRATLEDAPRSHQACPHPGRCFPSTAICGVMARHAAHASGRAGARDVQPWASSASGPRPAVAPGFLHRSSRLCHARSPRLWRPTPGGASEPPRGCYKTPRRSPDGVYRRASR